jgi:hypothetical protein
MPEKKSMPNECGLPDVQAVNTRIKMPYSIYNIAFVLR